MPPVRVDRTHFSPDIGEFIALLHKHAVHYVVVGGEAVIFHGHARLTGDVDFFFDRDGANARRLFAALMEFWDGDVPGVHGAEVLVTPSGDVPMFYMSVDQLVKNKKATARPKDLDDLAYLQQKPQR